MSVFKFTPDFMDSDQIDAISVGRKGLLSHSAEKILGAVRDGRVINMIFVGPRGIGKSHTVLRLASELEKEGVVTLAKLSEEEYSISSLEEFLARVLDVLGEPGQDTVDQAREVLKEYRRQGRPVVILAENLQMLFAEMEEDLPSLRSIILEDQSFFIIGTALSKFEQITSPSAAFYNFFEMNRLKGLSAAEIGKLVRRLIKDGRADEISQDGLRILTGGNPRLVHMLCDIMEQRESGNLEKSLMALLDRLTPFYQARMDNMPSEKRRVFDALALSDGPSTPTEVASRLKSKNTVVTAQMARLKNDGVVERVKLRQKKETRYQVSDRLYRVWREFRTRGGRAKTAAFVRFLRLWYSRHGLVKEYYKESDALEYVPSRHAGRARPGLYATRCILNATTDGAEFLYDAVDKFADKEDYEGARSAIREFRSKKKGEPDRILSTCNEIVAKNAELAVIPSGQRKDHILGIFKYMKKADRAITASKKTRDRNILHAVSSIVGYAMELGDLDLADSINNHAQARLGECKECMCLASNRISIMMERDDHAGALKAVDDSLSEKQNLGLIACRAMIHVRTKDKARAMLDVQILLKADGFPYVALAACARLSMFAELSKILRDKAATIKAMEEKERNAVVEDLLTDMIMGLHGGAPEAGDSEAFTECVKILKPFITPDIMSLEPTRFLIEHSHGVERVGRTLDVLFKSLDRDQLGMLAILKGAADYARRGDTDSLERLHPEQRELAFDMIAKISPGTRIPQEVLDSVSCAPAGAGDRGPSGHGTERG